MTPEVGQTAPEFILVDTTGTPRALSALTALRDVVLVFYRGHW